VTPSSGLPAGGRVVTISGSGFLNEFGVTCKFGTMSASAATFFSSATLLCVVPALSADTSYPVEISNNNGVTYTTDGVLFFSGM